jgi:hypothetical protein
VDGAPGVDRTTSGSVIGVFVRASAAVALLFAVVIVLVSPAVVYGEAQPLALSAGSGPTMRQLPRSGGRIFYLSVVHERRAPWDVLADLVGRHDATAPRVAASPGPDSASGDGRSRQAAIDAWQAAQRAALGAVQTTQPEVWPAVGSLHGDSAGLAYLLRYLDVLLPGDITGGVDLAATGVIGTGGSIEPIGGLDQKVAAARSAGVGVVFVPALNNLGAVPTSTSRSDDFLAAVRASGLWPWQPRVVATAPYAADGAAARHRGGTAVVALTEPVDALAWLCGYTGEAGPCRGAGTLLSQARD